MVAPGHSVAPAGPTKTPLDREDISLEDTLNQLLVDDLLHPDLDTGKRVPCCMHAQR